MQKKRSRLVAWLCRSTVFVGILSCGVGMSGSAFANLITNGNFETPVVPPGGFISVFTGSSFAGWAVVGAPGYVSPISGLYSNLGFTFRAQEGDQWLDLTGPFTSFGTGIQQTVPTDVGTAYDLSFWIGNQVN